MKITRPICCNRIEVSLTECWIPLRHELNVLSVFGGIDEYRVSQSVLNNNLEVNDVIHLMMYLK